MGHHQATFIIGETTALYTLSCCAIRHIVVFVANFLATALALGEGMTSLKHTQQK
jgi:hypothetical protein